MFKVNIATIKINECSDFYIMILLPLTKPDLIHLLKFHCKVFELPLSAFLLEKSLPLIA